MHLHMETRSRLRPIGVVEVVVLGDVNLDLIAHLPRFPNPGQDVLVNSVEVHCGGSAANTAAALSRLGLRARLIGRVGQEPMALMALNCLKKVGVLLSEVQSDPTHTTGLIYIIVTPDGERTMLSDRGANVLTNPDEIRDTPFRQARFFHLSGYALLVEPQRRAALRALDMAREYRLTTSLDPGLMLCETAPGDVQRLLPELDILMPTLAEAQALTGHSSPEACARDLERHCSTALAIKLGQDGCLLAADGGMVRLPAFAIQAQDTTGAGDAFDAGLIAGHLAGLDWVSAALLGNACGAVAASRVGAGDRPPDAGEVGALLAGHLAYPAFAQHHTSIELAMRFLAQGPQGS